MDSNLKEEVELGAQEVAIKGAQAFGGLPMWQRVVLVLFIVGTIPGYYLTRWIVQFSFERSYEKYLVNAKQLAINPKPLSIGSVTVLSLGDNQYAMYAQVENQNLDLALSDARYSVELKNNTNATVGRSIGSYFALPGEKKYLVVSRITAQAPASSATITFTNELWQNPISIPKVDITATDPIRSVQSDPLAYVAEGEIVNNSPYNLQQVSITVLLFDSSSKIVAVARRDEFAVAPRVRRAYKLLWPGFTGSGIVRAQVQVETNTLSQTNLQVNESAGSGSLDRPDGQE